MWQLFQNQCLSTAKLDRFYTSTKRPYKIFKAEDRVFVNNVGKRHLVKNGKKNNKPAVPENSRRSVNNG